MDKDYPAEGHVVNLAFLENLYQHYQQQPSSLSPSWQQFFQGIENQPSGSPALSSTVQIGSQQHRIAQLIEAYRRYGHYLATINPLAVEASSEPKQLNLEVLGFKSEEKNQLFPTLGILPKAEASLDSILDALRNRYCRSIGFEFTGLNNLPLEQWLQQQIESDRFTQPLAPDEKRLILKMLDRAELLENFLHTRHTGKKRFSLEGANSLIPMLTLLISQAAKEGVEEIFIGMSHRGRLNVLANILNKSFENVFRDFDEDYVPFHVEGMGDIRYHKGHANESVKTPYNHNIKLTMAPNPSHLESIDPVIEGQTRAKQFLVGDETERKRILPLLMHGDAALAGQGVVYETLQLSQLPGYETGGTIHIAINNQIGFTTLPKEGRSTPYCTDIAHTFGIPVLHVNGEDPESCVRVALFALDIRQRFHCDVFIDFNCYRKYGHNEGDEPAFTQPLEYQLIRQKKPVHEVYRDQLIQEGVIEQAVTIAQEEQIRQELQTAYAKAQQAPEQKNQAIQEVFNPFQIIDTRVDLQLLKQAAERFSTIPADFHPHPKLANLFKERLQAVQQDKELDWGLAEFLAYATLVWEGTPVRLAGQDSGRGTFSHRHALWVDQVNQTIYSPLAHLKEGQGRFEVINSFLSEVAALGFEYGYSTVCSKGLTIWEAQFGDFVNAAQVIIDQYLASGEQKWGQLSNLVLFLPHGFEGQGPEHSSARLERFLTLTGHDNYFVVNPTAPSQLFHLLRRQVKQPWMKPTVVLTPKGLLRHPACISRLADLTEGQFYPILDDPTHPKQVRRVVLCSGRIYYDLDNYRQKEQKQDIAIVRIEQLYPLDEEGLKKILANYGDFQECLWVQDEPQNMGAWTFISAYLPHLLPSQVPFSFVGRERSATPATGFYAQHKQEQAQILQQVFQT